MQPVNPTHIEQAVRDKQSSYSQGAVPQSKGWFPTSPRSVGTALCVTVGAALVRTYLLSEPKAKLLDVQNLFIYPLVNNADHLNVLAWRYSGRIVGKYAIVFAGSTALAAFLYGGEMRGVQAKLMYGATATALLLLTQEFFYRAPASAANFTENFTR